MRCLLPQWPELLQLWVCQRTDSRSRRAKKNDQIVFKYIARTFCEMHYVVIFLQFIYYEEPSALKLESKKCQFTV